MLFVRLGPGPEEDVHVPDQEKEGMLSFSPYYINMHACTSLTGCGQFVPLKLLLV